MATTYIEILRKPRMRERKHQLVVSEKAQVKVRTRGKKSSSREKKKEKTRGKYQSHRIENYDEVIYNFASNPNNAPEIHNII